MNLKTHYTSLWEKSLPSFQDGTLELDPLLDAETDQRFGLTLLARPSPEVKAAIHQFLLKLQQLEPQQYYYPATDLHVTILSVISCYQGFDLSSIDVGSYIGVIEEQLKGIKSFTIEFTGITASPASVLIQGFPVDKTLNDIRNRIKNAFKSSTLEQSIDKRYTLQTAHSTAVRFREPLSQPKAFLQQLQEYRSYTFGTSDIREIELVYNDWYQRTEKVQVLHTFNLA